MTGWSLEAETYRESGDWSACTESEKTQLRLVCRWARYKDVNDSDKKDVIWEETRWRKALEWRPPMAVADPAMVTRVKARPT